LDSYRKYINIVGDATFIDIARCTDPACVDQPWERLKSISEEFGAPKVVQIWTKGPRQVLKRGQSILETIRKQGTIIICQLTVTGFGPIYEPLVPWPIDWEGIDKMIDFLGSPNALLWRYDPIIPGVTDLKVLENLVKEFAKRGISRAAYNFGEYGLELVRKRMGKLYDCIDFESDRNKLALEIERIGRENGIDFMILAEAEKLDGNLNLTSRGNWQYEWLVEISKDFPSYSFLPGAKRPGCMCAHSFDVGIEGQYKNCHGCVYCFAI
jgi:DNA repair photolyase